MKTCPRSVYLLVTLSVMLPFVISACASPTTPTPASPVVDRPLDAVNRANPSFSGTSTTWSCLTAGGAGAFVPAGCRATGINLAAQDDIAAALVPGPSTNLSGSVNGSTVTLTWLAPASPDPATSYVIEAGSSSGASNIAVFDTGSVATTLTVTGVPAGTYFVRVRAKNSSGVSPPSNEIALTVGSTPCTPGPPTGFSASVNGTSVTFTWSAPGGACAPVGYTLLVGSSPGASNLGVVALAPSPTSFAASNVPFGTYFVRVTSGGAGAPASNEVVVTIALRGEVTDPVGDALRPPNVPNPPDLVFGTADVRDGNINFAIRLAPGTFDVQSTLLILYLDTDQNQSTGIQTVLLGADYLVSMFGPNPAIVQQAVGNTWMTVGSVPMAVAGDGRDVAIPLTLVGRDDGRLNFRVSSFFLSPNGPAGGILDTMPSVSAPPGRVQ